MRNERTVQEKSKAFALRIIKLYQYLCEQKREFILSKQVLRSGTSIGANISEAEYGISRNDFLAKMYIALKECAERKYWLELLHESEYLEDGSFQSIMNDCEELLRLLSSITKTTREGKDDGNS